MQTKIQQITTFQMLMSAQRELNQAQLLVAAVHSLNIRNGLICYNSKNEQCQFPQEWLEYKEDKLKIYYKINSKKIQFTFKPQKQKIVIRFKLQNTSDINRVDLHFKDNLENNIKIYQFNLKQFFTQKNMPSSQPTFYRKIQNNNKLLIDSQNQHSAIHKPQTVQFSGSFYSQGPYSTYQNHKGPFGQQQYVGPNSSIFTNPYRQEQKPSFNTPPLGSRYDPVDPFDNPLIDRSVTPGQFFGFDQNGLPLRNPKILKPSLNPHNFFNKPNGGGFNNFPRGFPGI